jgi:tetratricopeptide (TPR) repeat protein
MISRMVMRDFFRQIPSYLAFSALLLAVSAPALTADEDRAAVGVHILQAEVALQNDDYLAAVREYRMAAELSSNVENARVATRTAFGLGFNEEALRSAARWLELEEDSDEALAFTAQLELRIGKIRDSQKSFETLIKRGKQHADEQLLSLLPLLADENPQDVDALMRRLTKSYKNSAKANYAAAATALQADDFAHAKLRALRAAELDPRWLKAKLLYARALLLSGERDEAIEYTARIVGDDPDPDPDARMELALMLLSAGRDDDALSQVNQVLLEQASRADALRLMAIINFRQNNLDAAWDDFEDLLASGRFTMDALFYLGQIADYRKEYDRAIQLYAGVKSGQNAVSAQRRASALEAFQEKDPAAGIQRLIDFGNRNPRFAIDMLIARAQLLDSLQREDEALEIYDKVIVFRPDEERLVLGRAELLLRMDRVADSIKAYREAADRWPDSATTLNALGYTLADRTTQYSEAEKHIRNALKMQPENPAIIDSLGWVLFKLGRYDDAAKQLENAYEKFPDHEVAAHLVEVLVKLERSDEALELLAKADLKDPESELLKDARERLFPESQ